MPDIDRTGEVVWRKVKGGETRSSSKLVDALTSLLFDRVQYDSQRR